MNDYNLTLGRQRMWLIDWLIAGGGGGVYYNSI